LNKEDILKEYEETIQKILELSTVISNFDNNDQFTHSSYDLLTLLDQNLNQKLKILEMIALNEKMYEIYDIQRKYINKLTSTSGN
jgi:hypothetical protein